MNHEANASLRAAPGGPFDIIIADPPWNFASNSQKNPGRNARRHYDCMSLPDIQGLPVSEIASKDALLLLWVTVPHLENGLATARAWGFKYVSEIVWVKEKIGTGFWVRNRHEKVLICKRGRFPCPKPAPFPDSVIEGQQREHSRKPDRLHEMVDDVPDWHAWNKLEMFARQRRKHWVTWGDEPDRFTKPDPEADFLLGEAPQEEELLA